MIKNILLSAVLVMVTTACASKESHKVAALQKTDKHLGCAEVKLEINEAQFYRTQAEKNKRPGVGSLVMPIGYISSYMDADEAIQAADSRIDYLTRIYDIIGCEKAEEQMQQAQSAATIAPAMPVQGVAVQGVPMQMMPQGMPASVYQPMPLPRGGVGPDLSSAVPAAAVPSGWTPVGYATPFANPQYVTTLPSAHIQAVSPAYYAPAQVMEW